MDNMELAALCYLHSLNGIGNRTLELIKKKFGRFDTCCEAGPSLLHKYLTPQIASVIIESREKKQRALERIRENGFEVLCIEDEEYPLLLQAIPNPPYLLYYRGEINILNQFCLAIVGARAATIYGRNSALKLAEELAAQGIAITSGLARGIDTEAHRGALNVGGKTIAVLGSGLNVIYPRENTKLFNEISESGIVISEFPMDTPPEPGNFPMRNRIISGLSRGVVVVEAREKSGALITTDFALEQGRDVFALPGPVTSRTSIGPNRLIQQGAKLIITVQDIIDDYCWEGFTRPSDPVQQEILFASGQEDSILQWINYEGTHIDEILQLSGFNIGEVSTQLLKYELQGIIASIPGNYYVKLR
ncbi:MAG: DNA-processing protein DprA [Syntrophomonadaceae bacterium]